MNKQQIIGKNLVKLINSFFGLIMLNDETNSILIDALNNNGALKIYGSDALKVIDFTIEMLENKKKDLLVKLGQ